MTLWCEENVYMPVYLEGSTIAKWIPMSELPRDEDEYGRSYRNMWEQQKEILREALEMKDGRFKHTLIAFCWPRGEGKSACAVLVQLWKFFVFSRQRIMPAANSKDQIVFAHYELMRDIILYSPNLLARVGRSNIKEKEIRLRDKGKRIVSYIRTITSFSGLKPNLTGYTFSEMFQMIKHSFFYEIDGSTRNTPNALGVIDSTVSDKLHPLYRLYRSYVKGKDPQLYVSYRSSEKGHPADYWHPHMSEKQLNSYRERFLPSEFAKFFLNLWSAGAEKVFTPEMVEAVRFLGVDGQLGNHGQVIHLLERKNKIIEGDTKLQGGPLDPEKMFSRDDDIERIDDRLWPVASVVTLQDTVGTPRLAPIEQLEAMGTLLDTDWVLCGGFDRADPMKTRSPARTMFVLVAKGLPGSRSNIFMFEEGVVHKYVYVVLQVANLETHYLDEMKDVATIAHSELDGIDVMCGERWGMWDLGPWSEEMGVKFEAIFPTYDRQRAAFIELFQLYNSGRIKCSPTGVMGSKDDDVLQEEPLVFDHDSEKRKFGSTEKHEKFGIQDDTMYALAWAIYGGRLLGPVDFRSRSGIVWFGQFIPGRRLR